MRHYQKKSGNIFAAFLFCLLLTAANIDALEISRGSVRLSLHEKSGRFSLYGMNKDGRFEPFFSDVDPRTSFIELNVNNRLYRLGDSSAFRFRVENSGETPAIVFESKDLEVREEFSFLSTAASPQSNGVEITIRVRNRREDETTAGLRLLLDTSLGEGLGKTPFFLNGQGIPGETLIGGSAAAPWVSRGASLSFMGSIGRGAESLSGEINPDYLHFANWKRLNEASGKSAPGRTAVTGRNFNYPPYSINDAAVCYYYAPRPLPRYGELCCVILLSAEDPQGFFRPVETAASPPPASSPEEEKTSAEDSRAADLALLQDLLSRMDYYLEGKIEIPGEELSVMEETITRLKARYNVP